MTKTRLERIREKVRKRRCPRCRNSNGFEVTAREMDHIKAIVVQCARVLSCGFGLIMIVTAEQPTKIVA